MKSRALRLALATLFIGVLGGAAYVTWTEESLGQAANAAARRFEDGARAASRALLDIKSAQPGYVAAGQGDEFWTAKIDKLAGPARESLATLRRQAGTLQAQTQLDSAIDAFEDFEQMDRRAREYTRGGQRLLASDLVFSDGVDRIDGAVAALDGARESEAAAHDATLRHHRRRQWLVLGATGAFSLAALLLLIRRPGNEASPVAAASQTDAPAAREPAADFPVTYRTAATAARPADTVTAAAAVATPPAAPPAPSIDLDGIASLCSELAKLVDGRALPGAMERAARLLQASGIILWIADPDGRELVPVVSHGYPAHLLTRLGTIDRDAENVTAAAFRTGLVQTLDSSASSPGAIAAPLPTPAGPIGVMAAEVLNHRERHQQTLSVAAIVAAQLATLMAPPVRAGKAEALG